MRTAGRIGRCPADAPGACAAQAQALPACSRAAPAVQLPQAALESPALRDPSAVKSARGGPQGPEAAAGVDDADAPESDAAASSSDEEPSNASASDSDSSEARKRWGSPEPRRHKRLPVLQQLSVIPVSSTQQCWAALARGRAEPAQPAVHARTRRSQLRQGCAERWREGAGGTTRIWRTAWTQRTTSTCSGTASASRPLRPSVRASRRPPGPWTGSCWTTATTRRPPLKLRPQPPSTRTCSRLPTR